MEQMKVRKRRWGDRYDGYRVRETDPLFYVIPHIMRTRLDSQVFFEEEIDISTLREFVLKHRADIPGLSTYHIIVAAVIRTIAQRPRLNRFVSGRKIYARNYLRASLAIKKSKSDDAEEMLVMPEFTPYDTLCDIAGKFNKLVDEARTEDVGNQTDTIVRIINYLPGSLVKFVVWAIRTLDSFGKMPKIINRLSPFHSSLFVTNVGSIGLNSIYHHLYEFGTTSMFLAIGKKETVRCIDGNGEASDKTVIKVRFVLDERICDGFYFATAIKHFKKIMKKPELLLAPPDYVGEDY